MMTLRVRSVLRFFLSLCLLTVFLAACAAETPTVAPVEPEMAEPSATAPAVASATNVSAPGTAAPTVALPETVIPAATSRGPDLHATDPATVNLASGGLQLVEFFRFT